MSFNPTLRADQVTRRPIVKRASTLTDPLAQKLLETVLSRQFPFHPTLRDGLITRRNPVRRCASLYDPLAQTNLRTVLLHQDTFFYGPGVGPDYDYPNPRDRRYRLELRTFLHQTPLELLGRDTFFYGPGVGPDYDYPNPKAKPRNRLEAIASRTPMPLLVSSTSLGHITTGGSLGAGFLTGGSM